MVIEDVICDRCGTTCDVYADRRDAEGRLLIGRMKTTESGRIEIEQTPENVPPDFAYASLASNRRLELEGGVGIDAELCAVCTTALIEFIDAGQGPGVRVVPVEISF